MAIITGKTEFARRVLALNMTLVELQKLIPYSLQTLQSVSDGRRKLSPRLDFLLSQLEKTNISTQKALLTDINISQSGSIN